MYGFTNSNAVNHTNSFKKIKPWIELLRWNRPTGRLILIIPAGWSLWLTPQAPPELQLLGLIILGGLSVSAAGCIANDLWDRNYDRHVTRTKGRPLARGIIGIPQAISLLLVMLLVSLLIVINLPLESRTLCIALAVMALPPILIYPTAKRWLRYPQIILAFCWGFAVLIPWAASQGNLNGGWPLFGAWSATLFWTFGFDTVYAMADRKDDASLKLNSSALSLGGHVLQIVSISYLLACCFFAIAATTAGANWTFWSFWLISTMWMQIEVIALKKSTESFSIFGKHFRNQVLIGTLLLLGLIIGRST